MKWSITGADKSTGADRSIIVDGAADESAARAAGNRRGLLVETVTPIIDDEVLPTSPVVSYGSLSSTHSSKPCRKAPDYTILSLSSSFARVVGILLAALQGPS